MKKDSQSKARRTDILKPLCELWLIENKSSNDKSSYFLVDNFSIADSQAHIPTTMATPIVKKKHIPKNYVTYW